jgi:predicted nucleic acid-binding protein
MSAVFPATHRKNLGEFWNVLTRPAQSNGYGLTPHQANSRAEYIEMSLQLLPDSLEVHLEWRRLLVTHAVRGVHVHDARLVAAMQTHGAPKILTFNTRDFARYTQIEAIHPAQVPAP